MNTNISLNVWVVDDEPGMCLGASRTLKRFQDTFSDLEEVVSYNVESMGTGELFLDKIDQEKPHILLLDGKLPGIDGIGILKELHKREVSLVTIMITAYATLDKAVEATKLGAYDFLAKPFTPEELRYAVHKAARNVILTKKARQLEEEQRKVRFNFISVLAHELKSPLGAVEGYVNLIRTRQAGDNLNDYDHMIDRIGVRIGGMRKMIIDLLDLTRIEAGTSNRSVENLSIHTVVSSVIELHSEAAAERSINIILDCPETIEFKADSAEVEMLLNNFISNGIKYNSDGGMLTIGINKNDKQLICTFTDTGIGMTEEETERLFKEFSRIKNEKTRKIPGSGLGLSIVHKIIQLYNGNVNVSSVPDKGTTFTVVLEETT